MALHKSVAGGSRRGSSTYICWPAVRPFAFVFMCFADPDGPTTAWSLTKKDERVAAAERLRFEQIRTRGSVFKKSQVVEALYDTKTWLIFVIVASAYTVNGVVTGFGPLIVKTFGWAVLESILWQFPIGGIGVITAPGRGWLGSKCQNIRLIMLVLFCLPVIGYSMLGKKSFFAATIFMAYGVRNIVGTLAIRSQTKEHHCPELWMGLVFRERSHCITIAASISLYIVLWRVNKGRGLGGRNGR